MRPLKTLFSAAGTYPLTPGQVLQNLVGTKASWGLSCPFLVHLACSAGGLHWLVLRCLSSPLGLGARGHHRMSTPDGSEQQKLHAMDAGSPPETSWLQHWDSLALSCWSTCL